MSKNALEEAINEHVKNSLDFHESVVRDAKVIHDPIHGSNLFSREEVAVIDLPLVQRLRYISQTDVASLIYPSCHHTRFDHSLGVAVIADKIINAISQVNGCEKLIGQTERLEIRMAALLHDIGHGPFSHLSEKAYGESALFNEVVIKSNGFFHKVKPHEVMSYLMVTCPAFRKFFDVEIIGRYGISTVNLDRIGKMIIGKMDKPDIEGYMGDIINGVFDADKLDYIQRDSYFSGLKMGVDLDRVLHSVWVPTKLYPRRLTVRTGAVSALEQIMFDKVQLYSTIYHHQKVRSAECLMQAVFEILAEDPKATVNGKPVKNPADFLAVTDADILFGFTESEQLCHYVNLLKNRKLFKRALVICADTIENPKTSGLSELYALGDDPEGLLLLRQLIVDKCSGVNNVKDVWVDLPTAPSLREPSQFYVSEPGGIPRKLEEFFPTQDWLATYSENKLRGHIFCVADGNVRRELGECVINLFAELYDIKFKATALEWAKNNDE